MARKPPRSSGIVSRPRKGKSLAYSDYRRLSPDENEREGFTRKARRYVLKSVRKLTKRTPTISARQHETLRTLQEYGFAKPELATKAREHGALSYRTAAARETATKGKVAHYENSLPAKIARSAASGASIPEYTSGGRKKGGGGGYRVKQAHAARVMDLRRRKLAGEYLDNGDWHLLADFSEYYADPKRALLRSSPGSYSAKADE